MFRLQALNQPLIVDSTACAAWSTKLPAPMNVEISEFQKSSWKSKTHVPHDWYSVWNSSVGGSVTVNGGGVYENGGGSKRSAGGSPPKLMVSSPDPPLIVSVKSSLVESTQNSSLPPPPSTSTDSMPRNETRRPAPA